MFNTLYNDYETKEEFEFEAAMESADIDVQRAVNAYAAICEKADLDLREADLKCALESGDMNDLQMYYEEAVEKTSEKKQGLIKQIWERIKAFFSKIADFFKGKGKKQVAPNDEIEVDTGIYGFVKKIKNYAVEIARAIKAFVATHKVAAGAAGAVAVVLGGTAVYKILKSKNSEDVDTSVDNLESGKTTTIKGSEYDAVLNDAVEGMNAISDAADSVKELTQEDSGVGKIAKTITSIGTAFKNALSKFSGFVTGKTKRDDAEEDAREIAKIKVSGKLSKSDYEAAKKAGVSPTKFAQMAAEAEVVSKVTGRTYKWNNYRRFINEAKYGNKEAVKVNRILIKWRKSDEAKKADAMAKKNAAIAKDSRMRADAKKGKEHVDNMKAAGWLNAEESVATFIESVDEFFYNLGAYSYVSESYMDSMNDGLRNPFDELDDSDSYNESADDDIEHLLEGIL